MFQTLVQSAHIYTGKITKRTAAFFQLPAFFVQKTDPKRLGHSCSTIVGCASANTNKYFFNFPFESMLNQISGTTRAGF